MFKNKFFYGLKNRIKVKVEVIYEDIKFKYFISQEKVPIQTVVNNLQRNHEKISKFYNFVK